MQFIALKISLDAIRSLRQPLAKIRRSDPDLARQIRRAASSSALNLAEGSQRNGRDRKYHFRVAAGSADEVRAALHVAVAWGDIDPSDASTTLELLDRLLAMTWRLTH